MNPRRLLIVLPLAILWVLSLSARAIADTPLEVAAEHADLDRVEALLKSGESANEIDDVHLFVSSQVLKSEPLVYPAFMKILARHGLDWKRVNLAYRTAPRF